MVLVRLNQGVPGQTLSCLEAEIKKAIRIRGYRYRLRLQTIFYSLKGWTVERISGHFDIPERTVYKWRKIYKEKGLEGLRGKYFSRRL
ncbi:MAG: helix-turn-helix domain-containing protein [Planctomycetes bacterium]|nr:helix-turn-helix domain-containing protein [Planctomycetota bacterium]